MKYILIILVVLFSFKSLAEQKKKGFSTLPGWSGGYRYYYDLDEDEKSKLRLFDHTKATYPNKVFGPLNIIDNVLARDKGLVFEQEFKLSFHYDLKSYLEKFLSC